MSRPSPMPPDMACDICGKQPILGVAASPLVPASFAYCVDCAVKLAEPLGVFVYMYEDVSDKGEGLRAEMNHFHTFIDEQYVTWPEYVARRRAEGVST